MKHIWSVLCSGSSIDIETSALSLFNCLSKINISDKFLESNQKAIPIKLELISFWIIEKEDKDGKLEIKVELLNPKNKILDHFDKSLDIRKKASRIRNRIRIKGMPFSCEGRYFFKVKQKQNKKYETVANIPLEIRVKKKL